MSVFRLINLSRADDRLIALERVMAIFALILIATSWPLWWASSSFPIIPLLPGLSSLPVAIDRLLVILLLLGLGGLLLPRRITARNWLRVVVPILFALLILLDQHRIQTWSYQFTGMLLLFACRNDKSDESVERTGTTAEKTLRLTQFFIVSIYIYSALSKLDRHFITGGGFFLTRGMLELIGVDTGILSDSQLSIATSLLPIYELLVGCLLLFRGSQRFALIGSIVLHFALLLILGPWGLRHSWGVLIWNGYFIAQNLLLFEWSPLVKNVEISGEDATDRTPVEAVRTPRGWKKRAGYVLFAALILLPATEPWGYWDHWPSWAVYTSRQERFLILVEEPYDQPLPEEITAHLSPPRPLETLRFLNVNAWSLEAKHVPTYPQSRFQLGVWRYLKERYPDLNTQVTIEDGLDRFSTDRLREVFLEDENIESLDERYWLNSHPRLTGTR
ncbi:MAG: hypothetical protein CMJ46_13340 [Planctomyces sp.]|nr:hypothetical protein [Planctomyces sp.]